jgi:hypothetical protein
LHHVCFDALPPKPGAYRIGLGFGRKLQTRLLERERAAAQIIDDFFQLQGHANLAA